MMGLGGDVVVPPWSNVLASLSLSCTFTAAEKQRSQRTGARQRPLWHSWSQSSWIAAFLVPALSSQIRPLGLSRWPGSPTLPANQNHSPCSSFNKLLEAENLIPPSMEDPELKLHHSPPCGKVPVLILTPHRCCWCLSFWPLDLNSDAAQTHLKKWFELLFFFFKFKDHSSTWFLVLLWPDILDIRLQTTPGDHFLMSFPI